MSGLLDKSVEMVIGPNRSHRTKGLSMARIGELSVAIELALQELLRKEGIQLDGYTLMRIEAVSALLADSKLTQKDKPSQ